MENFGNFNNIRHRNIEQQLLQFFTSEEPKIQEKKQMPDLLEFNYTKFRKPYTTYLKHRRFKSKDQGSISNIISNQNINENFIIPFQNNVNLPYITQKQFYNQKKKPNKKEIHSYFKDKKNLFNYKNLFQPNKKNFSEADLENLINNKNNELNNTNINNNNLNNNIIYNNNTNDNNTNNNNLNNNNINNNNVNNNNINNNNLNNNIINNNNFNNINNINMKKINFNNINDNHINVLNSISQREKSQKPKFNFNNIHIKIKEKQKQKIKNIEKENEISKQTSIISSYHTISIPGGKGLNKKQNQDSYLNITKKEINYPLQVFGIFDGHGSKGNIVSEYIKQYFNNYFTKSETSKYFSSNFIDRNQDLFIYFKIRNFEVVKTLYISCEKNLQNEPKLKFPNCDLSGSTCNLILIFDNKNIICSNIGDCRSILIKKNNEIIQLSKDHKPNLKEEKDRILLNDGIIEKKIKNGKMDYFIFLKGQNIPYLNISRSFGDLIGKSIGVLNEPFIYDFDIEEEEGKCIIIGSSGIWEFVSNEKIRDIVIENEFKDNRNVICAEKIVEYAKKIWGMNCDTYDDITVTVIYFN